ncbi:linear amide C-N hydrolase [Treponema sp. OMZ 840]
MGKKMGLVLKKSNVHFPIALDVFQKKFGTESTKIMKDLFPEIYEEIRGITDQIEIDNNKFASWLMCMGCCLDLNENESTEIRGCTAFGFVCNNKVYYGRNNDLPPFLEPVSKSVYYQPEYGNKFILNTSAFVNGEEGMNEHGLAAAMTFVKPKINEILPGINSVFIVRLILEKCKTVNEAILFIKKLPVASSCNILVIDKIGEMAVLECHPQKINIRQAEFNIQNNKYIIAVNHFISNSMRKYDAGNPKDFMSDIRFNIVERAMKSADIYNPVEYLKNILMGKYGLMCQYPKDMNFTTIWSSVINISNGEILRAEGHPLKKKYISDTRLKPVLP